MQDVIIDLAPGEFRNLRYLADSEDKPYLCVYLSTNRENKYYFPSSLILPLEAYAVQKGKFFKIFMNQSQEPTYVFKQKTINNKSMKIVFLIKDGDTTYNDKIHFAWSYEEFIRKFDNIEYGIANPRGHLSFYMQKHPHWLPKINCIVDTEVSSDPNNDDENVKPELSFYKSSPIFMKSPTPSSQPPLQFSLQPPSQDFHVQISKPYEPKSALLRKNIPPPPPRTDSRPVRTDLTLIKHDKPYKYKNVMVQDSDEKLRKLREKDQEKAEEKRKYTDPRSPYFKTPHTDRHYEDPTFSDIKINKPKRRFLDNV